MKYLCLIYCEESTLEQLGKSGYDALVAESLDYDDELRQSGHFVAGHALQRTRAAATVRARNGKVTTTDGPFAETKEQLGGVVLIEARDLNEAIQVASRIPSGRFGCVEVRPVRELRKP